MIPALATDIVCCSIASCIDVRSSFEYVSVSVDATHSPIGQGERSGLKREFVPVSPNGRAGQTGGRGSGAFLLPRKLCRTPATPTTMIPTRRRLRPGAGRASRRTNRAGDVIPRGERPSPRRLRRPERVEFPPKLLAQIPRPRHARERQVGHAPRPATPASSAAESLLGVDHPDAVRPVDRSALTVPLRVHAPHHDHLVARIAHMWNMLSVTDLFSYYSIYYFLLPYPSSVLRRTLIPNPFIILFCNWITGRRPTLKKMPKNTSIS